MSMSFELFPIHGRVVAGCTRNITYFLLVFGWGVAPRFAPGFAPGGGKGVLRCGAGSRLLGQGSGCGVAAGVAGSVRMGVCARWRPQVCAEGLECAARVPLTNADASQEPAGSALGVRVLDNRLGCEPRADSPSFYQGVYSAVVYSGTKNNNKMHTLCCRNVPSTASASSELHAQASAVWLANPEKRCPCPALCIWWRVGDARSTSAVLLVSVTYAVEKGAK
jgi:hypothetical protein